MSSVPLPILFIMAVFFTMWLVLRKYHKLEQRKRDLPDLNAFLYANKLTAPRCTACNAVDMKDEGLTHGKDERRIVSCAQCNTLLYRITSPAPEA
jgi:phage FluMu protein Com